MDNNSKILKETIKVLEENIGESNFISIRNRETLLKQAQTNLEMIKEKKNKAIKNIINRNFLDRNKSHKNMQEIDKLGKYFNHLFQIKTYFLRNQ